MTENIDIRMNVDGNAETAINKANAAIKRAEDRLDKLASKKFFDSRKSGLQKLKEELASIERQVEKGYLNKALKPAAIEAARKRLASATPTSTRDIARAAIEKANAQALREHSNALDRHRARFVAYRELLRGGTIDERKFAIEVRSSSATYRKEAAAEHAAAQKRIADSKAVAAAKLAEARAANRARFQTPIERMNAEIAQHREKRQAGEFDDETFRRAVAESNEKFRRTLPKQQTVGTEKGESTALRDVQRALDAKSTALDRHKARFLVYRDELRKGIITEKEFAAAVRESQAQRAREERNSAAARKARKADSDATREAKAIIASTRTEQERHNIRVERYSALLRKGKLDQESFNRAVAQSKQRLEEAGRAAGGGGLSQLARMAAGYVSAGTAVGMLTTANREFLESADAAGLKYDELLRRFGGQAGESGAAAVASELKILREARVSGAGIDTTADIATQLVSSGFTAEEATGDSLREFQRVMAASNLAGVKGVNAGDLANAMSSYLAAQGLDKTGANVASVGQAVQALFKTTNLQLPDFAEFARESASMKGALTVPEQLSSLSVLRDVMSAEESATGMRNVVSRMRTTNVSPEKLEALDMIGVRPDEIDLIGEDFATALERLATAINKAPEEIRPGVLKKLFEEKGQATAQILIDSIEKIRERIVSQTDTAAFEADVKRGMSGPGVLKRRQEEERQQFLASQQRLGGTAMLDELDQMKREQGHSAFKVSLDRKVADLARFLGAGDNLAANISAGIGGGAAVDAARARVTAKSTGDARSNREIENEALLQRAERAAKEAGVKLDLSGPDMEREREAMASRSLRRKKKAPAPAAPAASADVAFATGGITPGSGSGDTVLAYLEPGEPVLRNEAADVLGRDKLMAANANPHGWRLVPTQGTPHFQSGGIAFDHPVHRRLASASPQQVRQLQVQLQMANLARARRSEEPFGSVREMLMHDHRIAEERQTADYTDSIRRRASTTGALARSGIESLWAERDANRPPPPSPVHTPYKSTVQSTADFLRERRLERARRETLPEQHERLPVVAAKTGGSYNTIRQGRGFPVALSNAIDNAAAQRKRQEHAARGPQAPRYTTYGHGGGGGQSIDLAATNAKLDKLANIMEGIAVTLNKSEAKPPPVNIVVKPAAPATRAVLPSTGYDRRRR